MKALVIYESIFGNTKKVAEAIADGLRTAYEVEIAEVSHAPQALDNLDLLVIGGPTHVWSMSRRFSRKGARDTAAQKGIKPVSEGIGVREWLESAHDAGGLATAAFDTAVPKKGFISFGSAAKAEASRLKRKGFHLIAEPEQFMVKDSEGPLLEGEADRARAWGQELTKSAAASRRERA